MKIELSNCNNIDNAEITLVKGKLNIRLAPNGTGKSTIATALDLSSRSESLEGLKPFKHRASSSDTHSPQILGLDAPAGVLRFNESYVEQFVFKPDELIADSFEIFVKSAEYLQLEEEINELLSEIKKLFQNSEDLDSLLAILNNMGNAFKLSKTGIARSSSGYKALAQGNPIHNVPPELEPYKPFIESDKNVKWVNWQTTGSEYAHLATACPYCSADTAGTKEKIDLVGKTYDKTTIRHLVSLLELLESFTPYLAPATSKKLHEIARLNVALGSDHESYLVEVQAQITSLSDKLHTLRELSAFTFDDKENVEDQLRQYEIDLALFSHLASKHMELAIEPISKPLEGLIEKAGELQGKIRMHQTRIRRRVEHHRTQINDFLKFAGYRYEVAIEGRAPESRLKLKHADHGEFISQGSQHLSFGEKNAFALVLFMYECLAKEPDLIILDDPVSSFDNNKKFAILEMLFRRPSDECLKGKTVLLLTHDIEPVIDTVRSPIARYFRGQANAAFLRFDAGVITEIEIKRDDVQSFAEVVSSLLASDRPEIVKLIHLRRYYDLIDSRGNAYQVLSNVFKRRHTPEDHRLPADTEGQYPALEASDLEDGCAVIRSHIPTFSYSQAVNMASDFAGLRNGYNQSSNGYEKLQLFRMLSIDTDNSVIKKFIDETYHVENDYLFQLNPLKYDVVPAYVVALCDELIANADDSASAVLA